MVGGARHGSFAELSCLCPALIISGLPVFVRNGQGRTVREWNACRWLGPRAPLQLCRVMRWLPGGVLYHTWTWKRGGYGFNLLKDDRKFKM